MRKTFELEDLDCANCAAKMEEAIKKLPGVKRVSVNFMTQKMILDAEDSQFDELRPPQFHDGIEGRPDRPSREQDVVD